MPLPLPLRPCAGLPPLPPQPVACTAGSLSCSEAPNVPAAGFVSHTAYELPLVLRRAAGARGRHTRTGTAHNIQCAIVQQRRVRGTKRAFAMSNLRQQEGDCAAGALASSPRGCSTQIENLNRHNWHGPARAACVLLGSATWRFFSSTALIAACLKVVCWSARRSHECWWRRQGNLRRRHRRRSARVRLVARDNLFTDYVTVSNTSDRVVHAQLCIRRECVRVPPGWPSAPCRLGGGRC